MGQGTFGMKTEVKGMKSIPFPDPLQARSVHWLATTKVILLCWPSQQIRDGKMLGCNVEPQNSHKSSQQIRDGKMLVCERSLVCVCACVCVCVCAFLTLHPPFTPSVASFQRRKKKCYRNKLLREVDFLASTSLIINSLTPNNIDSLSFRCLLGHILHI